MDLLLHTIALEPARWTPAKVSRPLAELLPAIAGAGVRSLEVFEPHVSLAPDEEALRGLFGEYGFETPILSSYLDTNPSTATDAAYATACDELAARVARFGFSAVRLFPGNRVSPEDEAAIGIVQKRLARLATQLPQTTFLLEAHDHSIADSPTRLVRLVEEMALPNIGLLYQPTRFEAEAALAQYRLQRPLIRHLHLQDRDAQGRFVQLGEGVLPWREILRDAEPGWGASIEFVPCGTSTPFDFDKALAQALDAIRWVTTLA